MNRRRCLLALTALPFAPWVRAGGKAFDPTAFAAARRTGKPVLVMVYAEWCPTCRKQDPAVQKVLQQPEFAGVQWLTVDFDMQDEVLEALGVRKQSTLIVYRGEREVARSTGEVRPEAIAEMLRKAL